MIEALIFDWGGVFSFSPATGMRELEARLGWPKDSLIHLFAAAAQAAAEDDELSPWHALETGGMDLEEFLARVTAHAPLVLGERPVDLELFTTSFTALGWLVEWGIYWEVVHRVRELRADGYRTGLLTNNVAEWREAWRSTIPVDELFDDVVDSSEVGLRKPDPAIYVLACERLEVAPHRAVFLDDRADNVEAARQVGMRGIVVGPDPRDALHELDLLLTKESRDHSANP